MNEEGKNITNEEINEEVFKRDIFTGDKIYLDLRLFFDFTIGNLLQLNPNNRKYVIEQIFKYKIHKDIDIKSTFPDIDTNETLLLENMKKHPNEIFLNSPMTLYYEIFKIDLNLIQNHLFALKGDKNVIIDINTYPLKLHREILKFIKKLFIKEIPNIKINFIFLNLATTTQERKFRKYDNYFNYYFPEASKNLNIQNIFDKLKYKDKCFYIYLPIDDNTVKDLVAEIYFQCFKFVKVIDKNMCMPLNVGEIKGWKNKNPTTKE